MKKLTSNLIKLTLFFAVSCPFAMADKNNDQYSGAITIHNQTPFTLVIIGDYLDRPIESNIRGKFVFRHNLYSHDHFLKPGDQIMPGDRNFIGYTEPQTDEVEGYLLLNILDTEEFFTAHYHFGKGQSRDNGSWIKLEQLLNDQPYPFISIRMIRGSVASKNLLSGTDYLYAYMLTLSMDDAAAACITDPYCLAAHFLRNTTPLVPNKTNNKNSPQPKNVEL